jgi:hypothetical protein
VIDCVRQVLLGRGEAGGVSVSADGAKVVCCRDSGSWGECSGGSECPFLGLGSFGYFRFGGSVEGGWCGKVRFVGAGLGGGLWWEWVYFHMDAEMLSGSDRLGLALRGCFCFRTDAAKGFSRGAELVVAALEKENPYLSIQEEKKRFGCLMIAFMDIQLVTGFSRANGQSAAGSVTSQKVVVTTRVVAGDCGKRL